MAIKSLQRAGLFALSTANRRQFATVVVTGSNSGIGKATATELAKRGHRVILACRNVAAAEQAVAEIKKKLPANVRSSSDKNLTIQHLDLTSLSSVKQFASAINSSSTQVDVLINNAGILPPSKRQLTKDGFEITFQTNYLGHFLLTNLLLDNIRKSSGGGRIINAVADPRAFFLCWPPYGFHFYDPKASYHQLQAYIQSKLAIALATKALHLRMAQENAKVSTFAVDPGVIRPDLGRNTSPAFKAILSVMPKFLFKTFEEGAETAVYCATQPGLDRFSGQFFQNSKPINPGSRATDQAVAKRLWNASEDLVKDFLKK